MVAAIIDMVLISSYVALSYLNQDLLKWKKIEFSNKHVNFILYYFHEYFSYLI